ncbi:MAG: site-specific DNA-methyltransferase [Pyrinomonadaceae bacterium]|nr:site-specific DNA-methyltransferase [Pyrinomonadaceae bacterium]
MKVFPTLPKPYDDREYGASYLGDALTLLDTIPDNSIDLVLTSPPFALTREKEYGNKSSDKYVEWFLPFARKIKDKLCETGSFILDLGGAYLPGAPARSIYQFEVLVHLCRELNFILAQEFYHYNPSRLPAPAEWVNVRRCRVKDSVNVVWWLARTKFPKADNRKVLKEYSASMKSLLRKGYKAKKRPSGHDISTKFSKDNGGAVSSNVIGLEHFEPSNLLSIANTESNSAYLRRCREQNITPHPARFPVFFAEYFIKFLTDEFDVVLDPFAGSNSTGFAANSLKRRWVSFELSEEYLRGAKLRFERAPEDNLHTRDTKTPMTKGLFSDSEKTINAKAK